MADHRKHIDTDRARGGQTPGIARWVLLISTVLIIVAMTWIVLA